MKTIRIPTCRNPFIVIINNKVYSYTAGETVEVPDEVAEVIESHTDAKPTEVPQTSSASTMKEWQKLLDVELTEAVYAITTDVDVNGNSFEVSELFFRVYMPAVTDGVTAYFRVGSGTKGFQYSFKQDSLLFLGGHFVIVDGEMHHIVGHMSTTTEFAYRLTTPYGGYNDGIALGVDKLASVTAGLSNNTLTMPVGTKIKVYGR